MSDEITSSETLQAVEDEIDATVDHATAVADAATEVAQHAAEISEAARDDAIDAQMAAADAEAAASRLQEEARIAELQRVNDHMARVANLEEGLNECRTMMLELLSRSTAATTPTLPISDPEMSQEVIEAVEPEPESQEDPTGLESPETMERPPVRDAPPVLRHGRRPLRRV